MNKVKNRNGRYFAADLAEREMGPLNARTARRFRAMSPKELFQSLVTTGIYTSQGKLAKEYREASTVKR